MMTPVPNSVIIDFDYYPPKKEKFNPIIILNYV